MSAGDTFDYIVIGAGSAGCVLAARLSEDPGCRVLLVEAGGQGDARIDDPLAAMSLAGSEFDWGFATLPEPAAADRQIPWSRGRVIGGSSAINYLLWTRGARRDFDSWTAAGNPGWGWTDLLASFQTAEAYPGGSATNLGTGGQVGLCDQVPGQPPHPPFAVAASQRGYPLLGDLQGGEGDGFASLQMTIRDGRRDSAARAYLDPARARPNLTVLDRTLVTRITIEHEIATGIEYLRDGAAGSAAAAREVLLCAGVVGSAHLLMLSGIGPEEQLERHGIPCIQNLPVGARVEDHPAVILQFHAGAPLETWGGMPGVGGFLRTDPAREHPDLELLYSAVPPIPGFAVFVIGIDPYSHGSIELASADPLVAPRIRGGYLSDQRDLDTLVRGIHLARDIVMAPAMAAAQAAEFGDSAPLHSDDELSTLVRATVSSAAHPVGSCRMGPERDTSVVDAALRVHGIDRLRVIDASVMPRIPSAHTNAPTLAIAEHARSFIRHDQAVSLAS